MILMVMDSTMVKIFIPKVVSEVRTSFICVIRMFT